MGLGFFASGITWGQYSKKLLRVCQHCSSNRETNGDEYSKMKAATGMGKSFGFRDYIGDYVKKG